MPDTPYNKIKIYPEVGVYPFLQTIILRNISNKMNINFINEINLNENKMQLLIDNRT